MSRVAFSYAVLRYVHDFASQEFLNVGVVVFVPALRIARARVQPEYARLSKTFRGFNGEYFRKVAKHIESGINNLSDKWLAELRFDALPTDAQAVGHVVLPPDDSSLQFSVAQVGLTHDPDASLNDLFERLVMRNQTHVDYDHRENEDVWKAFKQKLAHYEVLPKLQSVEIFGASFEYEFQHAWKNDKWHPLEPVSMDAEKGDTLKDRAIRWVGRATDLQSDPKLGKLYLLVGPPQLESLRVPYGKAIDLLRKMPIVHEIVKEDEADDFAQSFGAIVREHGLAEE